MVCSVIRVSFRMFGFCMHLTFQVADAGLFLRGRLIFFVGLIAAAVFFAAPAFAQNQPAPMEPIESFITSHCIDCHAGTDAEAGFDLESLSFDIDQFSKGSLDTTVWEKTLRRVDAREMPPASADRPKEADYQKFAVALNRILDDHSKRHPVVGRVGAVRRLTRTEYQNAVRDLLGIAINAADFLPKDESSHGFDNITVEELSPTSLSRYVSAAQKIAQAVMGGAGSGPAGVTIRVPADRTQESHVVGLPFGSRGGIIFEHHFSRSGLYEIELKLCRDRDEKVEGLTREHDVDVLIDRNRVHRFQVAPPKNRDFTHVDSHLNTRLQIDAGNHQVGVTFPMISSSLSTGKRQPFDAAYNRHRHPRRAPGIYQVSIVGPLGTGSADETSPRKRVFGNIDLAGKLDRDDAIAIIGRLAERAFRRPVTKEDLETPLRFYDASAKENAAKEGRVQNGSLEKHRFEKGIESALTSLLVNPNFLFRIEANQASADAVAPISDWELASRLSFFIWSSIPDQELLRLAGQGRLSDPAVLRQQVQRMLADGRSSSLVQNFASQWLYLRNLESITPDLRLFPDFDDNLRQAFRLETQGLFENVLRNDHSVLKLIQSDYTFLNQRLATHYGIPGVLGSQIRKVVLPQGSRRGGILRHGSVLMVTSYATRTSPTVRGNWILENILGTPAPPPPPDIPTLKESNTLEPSSLRERLAIHRQNPACASCHDKMDPIGFSLENYDAVGRWREFEGTQDIDSGGMFPDGKVISSVNELEQAILSRPQVFVRTLTEKMMTFALGRAVESFDGPAIPRIEATAAKNDYRISSIVMGIVLSDPFRYRLSESSGAKETE